MEANVSHGNAIILDFSYVCDMDYTAAKVCQLEEEKMGFLAAGL